MPVRFRTYVNDTRFGADYHALRAMLVKLDSHNYSFGRWDWMITHGYLEENGLSRIGLWEDDGKLVAAATYDCQLGDAYFPVLPGYEYLRADMLAYAKSALTDKDYGFYAVIPDGNAAFGDIAAAQGFVPTQEKECDAVYPISDASAIRYPLPEGFSVTSMKDTYDFYKYGQALWKGFNHEQNGEGPFVFDEALRAEREVEFLRPNINLDLKIAVVAPDGSFAAYCGMWHDPACQSALVEPVATDPAYRKMGLGRAAVLEGVRRCGLLGAKRAFVGSSQQFYYQIGFRPFATSTKWTLK